MYRLLIVDNERLIVENLVDLFSKAHHLNLEVCGINSSYEALDLMKRTKIDIVLSDIRMPGMNGLELQKEIIEQWPMCKIIFLTGYDDFKYVKEAIRNNSVDYLLKTEGEQAILETVEKTVKQLADVVEKDNLIHKARQQLQLARPVLQKDYLWSLAQGDPHSLRNIQSKFNELHLSLHGEIPVLLVIGRVDDWRDDFSYSDRDLMLYAIQNIAEEHLKASTQSLSIVFDKNKILWLIQPIASEHKHTGKGMEETWKRTSRFVQGTVESIQLLCKELLGLKVSFAVANEAREWVKAAEQLDTLRLMLSCGLGLGQESILLDQNQITEILLKGHNQELRTELKKIDSLAAYLENGQKQHFFIEFVKLTSLLGETKIQEQNLRLELYYNLVSIFLAHINRWGLHAEIAKKLDLSKLVRYESFSSWEEAKDYIYGLAETLFDIKWSSQDDQQDDLVKQIHWYVEKNLGGDLSLTKLGEVVGHNPYYLSKLYKQITQEGLFDFIINARSTKAKDLLAHSQLKISDIVRTVGFSTDQSFYRFFKKVAGVTPQEYRDTHSSNLKKR